MQHLGNPLVHLRLLGRMGKAVGADLVQAFEDDKIDSEAWAKMITKCRECDMPEQCQSWLEVTEQSETPPEGCRNYEIMMQLKTELASKNNR